jgi:cell division protein ZapE
MSVQSAYRARIAAGELTPDPGHALALEAMGRLEDALNSGSEPMIPLPFLKLGKVGVTKGIYLYGPVGRGKSTLMDLFFDSVPVQRKRRVHFHAFMQEVHGLIAKWRSAGPAERKMVFRGHKGDDPIAPTAARIADDARLLCFDEFQVLDIADAMILGRLFEALFARGVIVVATSNRAPEDLYENGLNRQLFEPFIAMLRDHLEVVVVDGPTDHRMQKLVDERAYFAPINPAMQTGFEKLWETMTGGSAAPAGTVAVNGRQVPIARVAGRIARAPFESLCDTALGPADYLALAEKFHVLFLENVPVMGPERRDVAKRFVTLVDAFYEAKRRLVMLAAAEPFGLYGRGDGAFEFQRTASRLHEMRGDGWGEGRPA